MQNQKKQVLSYSTTNPTVLPLVDFFLLVDIFSLVGAFSGSSKTTEGHGDSNALIANSIVKLIILRRETSNFNLLVSRFGTPVCYERGRRTWLRSCRVFFRWKTSGFSQLHTRSSSNFDPIKSVVRLTPELQTKSTSVGCNLHPN